MREQAARRDDPWQLSDGSAARPTDPDEDQSVELALLAYAQRTAARAGAEWFEAELARRDEAERAEREAVVGWRAGAVASVPELVDASVEDSVVGGAPSGLGFSSVVGPTDASDDPRSA